MSDDLVLDLLERARYFAGITGIGVPREVMANPPRKAAPQALGAAAVARGGLDSSRLAPETLAAVREDLGDCRRCKLAAGRHSIVFGQGDPNAALMFVGEAPGADEDEQGLAFVGKAGQLLTKIIEAIGLTRDQVFIANVIKCRPPQNRNPEPDEIEACQPFLERQIAAIQPQVLVGLGKFGGHWLLKTAEPISKIRGRLGEYHGIKVMPTYHPAYLLRNPGAKKEVWEDMKVVRALLGG
ncbi:MAG TPA: uracil-DNA glycosylase [Vicinamibacteria bacterium]|nr:uracil-DNA glycosylase [Vicinamibacteria bacterium]